MEMSRRPLKSRDTRWAKVLSSWLAQRRVTPNAISVAGMVFATAGGAGFVLAGGEIPWAAGQVWLGWMAAAAAVLTAYVQALGASLGQGQDFSGPMAKPQRMFFLTLGALGTILHPPVLVWALWVIAAGACLTSILRSARIYRLLP